MKKLLEETLQADMEKNKKKEYDNIYSKYTVGNYEVFFNYFKNIGI